MELDLHGFELDEAKMEVLQALAECRVNEDALLDLVHGYHGGILLGYFRSARFRAAMAREGFGIQRMEVMNRGKTRYHL
ncbi:MAG: hypothetical protein ACTSWW_08075, partial [Promethearchaeota archaeon]